MRRAGGCSERLYRTAIHTFANVVDAEDEPEIAAMIPIIVAKTADRIRRR